MNIARPVMATLASAMALATLPDGRLAVSGRSMDVTIWFFDKSVLDRTIDAPDGLGLDVHDGTLVAGGDDGSVRFYNIAEDELHVCDDAHTQPVWPVVSMPGGDAFTAGRDVLAVGTWSSQLAVTAILDVVRQRGPTMVRVRFTGRCGSRGLRAGPMTRGGMSPVAAPLRDLVSLPGFPCGIGDRDVF